MFKRRILLIFLFCSLVFTGCLGSSEINEADDPVISQIAVSVEKIQLGSLTKKIPLGGLLKAREEVYVVAKNPIFEIKEVLAEVGDYVWQGTPLITFDSREFDLQLKQAELALKRNQELYELGAISKFQLEQTETALENLRIQKENCQLLSPINGVVAAVEAKEGQLAGNTPLMVLLDLASLELEIQVSESLINRLSKGQTLKVSVPAAGEKRFTGTVSQIPFQVDPRTKAYPVKVTLPNTQGLLKDGMYGEVQLVVEDRDEVIVIPQAAVVEYEQQEVVFVVENDLVRQCEVKLGLAHEGLVEVVEGLQVGDLLIVEGQYGVREGTVVTPLMRGETS